MQKTRTRRIELLEDKVSYEAEDIQIIIQYIGVDENRNSFTSGGLLIRPGHPQEELPASYFDDEDLNEETT